MVNMRVFRASALPNLPAASTELELQTLNKRYWKCKERQKVKLSIFRYQITVSGTEDKVTYILDKRTGICFFVYLMMMPLPYSFNSSFWNMITMYYGHIRLLGTTVRLMGSNFQRRQPKISNFQTVSSQCTVTQITFLPLDDGENNS
jgi:hypothetical protein